MRALEGSLRSVSFAPHQTIFEQGDPHVGCYLICEGFGALLSRTANGRRLVIGVVGPGDLLGVGSFLGQQRHELSVQALTGVRAQYLARAGCERLVGESSLVTGRLLVALARQVKDLGQHMQLVAARAGVRERLAAALVELGRRCGSELPSGARRIELPLSCELLGQLIDSHRSTVDLELLKLERRGLIERASRRIVILNEAGLQELAQSLF
jgi:CRP-like cAMP-binding protein